MKKSWRSAVALKCDCCKKEYPYRGDDFETQEFFTFFNEGGYGSIFGYRQIISLDLCQHCIKERLGDIINLRYEGE